MAWYQAQNASTTLPTQMNPVAWGKMGQEIGTAMTTERNENAMKKAYADANKRPETEGDKAMQDQLWNLQVELVRLEKYLPVAKMNERKAQEQQQIQSEQNLRTTPDVKPQLPPSYTSINDRMTIPQVGLPSNMTGYAPSPTSGVSQNVRQPATPSAFPSNWGLTKPNVQGYQPNPMTGYQPNRGKY